MGLSCSSCGFRSRNPAFFRREKAGAFDLRRRFCLGCRPWPKASLGVPAFVGAGGLALLGLWAVAIGEGLEVGGYGLLISAGTLLGGPISLAIHELAHAAIALVFGRRVYQISIGTGRPLATFDVAQTQWIIGRDMGLGYVVGIPRGRCSRPGDLAVLAAGATANLAMVILLLPVGARLSEPFPGVGALIGGLILSNLLAGAGALIPGRHVRNGQSWPTDGLQILHTLRRKRSTFDWGVHHEAYRGAVLLRARRWEDALTHYRQAFVRYPDQPGFLGVQMHLLSHSRGHEAASTFANEQGVYLEEEREVPGSVAASWGYLWGMAAWSHIRARDGDLRAAEVFTRKAFDAASSPYAHAVQGALLARTGEREAGLSRMLTTLKALESSGDRLEFCDFIIAEGLEDAELKTADFQSWAAHLRTTV